MYERILLPVDGSDASLAAIEHAASLARRLGAAVRALHVVPAAVLPAVDLPGYAEPLRDDLRREGEAVLAAAVERLAGVAAAPLLREEGPAGVGGTILEVAAAEGADLVVMGTSGRAGLERVLLGSVAAAVVDRSRCPVLLVKAGK